MIYFFCFVGGIIYGIAIVGIFTATKSQQHEDELDAAIREAYLDGYEAGIKTYEEDL